MNTDKSLLEAQSQPSCLAAVMCCFNCVHLGMKQLSGKHWCMNDNSYLSGLITQPHIKKCELHVLEK
jgi:hypothetical protein